MAEQKRMIRGWLPKTDNLLLKVEILAILLLVIIPHFTRESIIDFTRSSFLSLGISCYRRLIGTTLALPPHYPWIFSLERTVTFYMLIFYHSLAKSWGIAFCFYLLSTICSSSIVYFMPTRKWQGLPNKNPSPEADKGEVLVQMVDILQRLMFWMERLVVLVCIILVSRYVRFSTVFFCFSDFIYLICFALTLEVDPSPAGKPDYLFWIERIAVMILELHCTDQTPYSLFIARGLFFLTNSCYSVDSYTPTSKGLISRAYNPKVREAENGLQAEKKEAKMADEPQKEKFEVQEGENNNWEKELVAKELVTADQVHTVSSNDSSELMEDNMKTAENESNKEALLEDTGEVERLRAENDNLKREKEALEREKESLERKKEALEDHNQKLDAMLVEAKMKSQALIEELESHSEFEEQMLETLKICKQDCRKWEQESKDIGAKFEEVIVAIGKEQRTLLNGQGHVCKCKEESKKWESEKIALNKQLEEANSWYVYYFNAATAANYWNQYYMQRENNYGSWMRCYENNIYSLVKSNTDLAKRLEAQTTKSTRYRNRVYDYKERCRALEEDKNNLTAKLCAADASSELYRSMLHDLAS